MLQSKYKCALLAVALGFLGVMVILAVTGQRQAKKVSEGVLRFHIVANSDSAADQAVKLKVRDGIAELTDRLFAGAENKAQAIEIARENQSLIEDTATEILRDNGDDSPVNVRITNLYFPTKTYEDITFPAGRYDAISVDIGAHEGQNFWCVMYPSLCVPSVSTSNEVLLSEVLEKEEVDLVTHPYTFKFKLVEWCNEMYHFFTKK